MIANKPIRVSLSIISIAVALCCFTLFFLFFATEAHFSLISLYRDKTFLFFISLVSIGLLSFCVFLSWQSTNLKISKQLCYIIAINFLVSAILLFELMSFKTKDMISILPFVITPAVCFFLLGFSKINPLAKETIKEYDTLDANFLSIEEDKNISIFWKPNRIISFTAIIFTILLFLFIPSVGLPIWCIIVPCIFLILASILWLLPKIGSWVFSTICMLIGIGIPSICIVFITSESPSSDKAYIFSSLIIVVLSFFLLCLGIVMLLLSKEAKTEWKK